MSVPTTPRLKNPTGNDWPIPGLNLTRLNTSQTTSGSQFRLCKVYVHPYIYPQHGSKVSRYTIYRFPMVSWVESGFPFLQCKPTLLGPDVPPYLRFVGSISTKLGISGWKFLDSPQPFSGRNLTRHFWRSRGVDLPHKMKLKWYKMSGWLNLRLINRWFKVPNTFLLIEVSHGIDIHPTATTKPI